VGGEQNGLFGVTRRADPAVEAWRQVCAADEDDVAYTAAMIEFEASKPVTLRGVGLKLKLYWTRTDTLSTGDQLTAAGRNLMNAYRKTIEDALGLLAREAKKVGFRL
jgi:hypothetical protein